MIGTVFVPLWHRSQAPHRQLCKKDLRHVFAAAAPRVALAPSFKMSGKRRNQRGAAAVFVLSGSAFS